MPNPIYVTQSTLNQFHDLINYSIDLKVLPKNVVYLYIRQLIKIEHLLGTDELEELRKLINPDVHLNSQ